ncbi:hypothetical protein [Cyanobium sp. CH-040]|nr:hypothetical protein [Cyanobium sp. CH-040]
MDSATAAHGAVPKAWRWLGFDIQAVVETLFGAVVGLIALFSSY